MIKHAVQTSDGRTLNVAEDGDKNGKPVFALHGTPGSILLCGLHVMDASRRGIRLISYDRAGYGGSSPHPGRKVASAAGDVATIADSLGLERFAVWGISGGGPHALGCAALLRDRVVATASLASPAPYPSEGLDWLGGQGEDNVTEFRASMAGPEELDRFLKPMRAQLIQAEPEDIAKIMESLLPQVDKAVLSGEIGRYLALNMKEGLRTGHEGWKEDDLAFISGWGFSPSDVKAPLLLLQGKHDKMVPYAHGEWLAENIHGAEARLSEDDGHLTLYERVGEAHGWLLKHF